MKHTYTAMQDARRFGWILLLCCAAHAVKQADTAPSSAPTSPPATTAKSGTTLSSKTTVTSSTTPPSSATAAPTSTATTSKIEVPTGKPIPAGQPIKQSTQIASVVKVAHNPTATELEASQEISDKEVSAIVQKPLTEKIADAVVDAGAFFLEKAVTLGFTGAIPINIPYWGARDIRFEAIDDTAEGHEGRRKIIMKIVPGGASAYTMSYEEQEKRSHAISLFSNLDFEMGKDGKLVGGGDAVIQGRKARVGLRKITFGDSMPMVIQKMVFELKFYEPVTLKLFNDADAISFQRAALVISAFSQYPVYLISRVKIFGREVQVLIQFGLDRIVATLRIPPKKLPTDQGIPLKEIIRWSPKLIRNVEVNEGYIECDLWRKSGYGYIINDVRLTEFDPQREFRVKAIFEPKTIPQPSDYPLGDSGAMSIDGTQWSEGLLDQQPAPAEPLPEAPFAPETTPETPPDSGSTGSATGDQTTPQDSGDQSAGLDVVDPSQVPTADADGGSTISPSDATAMTPAEVQDTLPVSEPISETPSDGSTEPTSTEQPIEEIIAPPEPSEEELKQKQQIEDKASATKQAKLAELSERFCVTPQSFLDAVEKEYNTAIGSTYEPLPSFQDNPKWTYTIDARVTAGLPSKNVPPQGSIYITAAELKVPGIGTIPNATLSLTSESTFRVREGADWTRQDLNVKTMQDFKMEAAVTADCIQLGKIGTIKNASITLGGGSVQREPTGDQLVEFKQGSLQLRGVLYLNIDPFGPLRITVDSSIVKRQGRAAEVIFKGTIDKKASYHGISFEQLKVMYGRMQPTAADELRMSKQRMERYKETFELARTRQTARTNIANSLQKQQATQDKLTQLDGQIQQLKHEKIDPLVDKLTELQTQRKNIIDNPNRKEGEVANTDTIDQQIMDIEKQLDPFMKEMTTAQEDQARALGTMRDITNAPTILQAAIRRPTQPLPPKMPPALTLVGTMKAWGLPCVATFVTYKDETGARRATMSARATIKNFKPFGRIKILPSPIRDINFEDVFISLILGRFGRGKRPQLDFGIGGTAKLFDIRLRAALRSVSNAQGTKGILLYTIPATSAPSPGDSFDLKTGDIRFTDFLTPLRGKAGLDSLIIRKPQLVFSSVSMPDTTPFALEEDTFALPAVINKGLMMVAHMPLTGPLDPVRSFLSLSKDHMFGFAGWINTDKLMTGSKFAVSLSQNELKALNAQQPNYYGYTPPGGKTQFTATQATFAGSKGAVPKAGGSSGYGGYSDYGSSSSTDTAPAEGEEVHHKLVEFGSSEIYFVINPLRLDVGISTELIFNPPHNPEPLRLKGSLEGGATGLTLGAQLLGIWDKPFGLKGWALGNVGLVAGFTPGVTAPSRFGGAAMMRAFNKFTCDFKFMFDPTAGGMALEGNISKVITIFDIIKLCFDGIGVKIIGTDKFPMPYEINNVSVRFAPFSMRIGDQMIEYGYLAKADINILGEPGHVEMSINDMGLKAFGTLHKVNWLNVLKITDAEGTGDPKLDVELTFERQKFLVTGMIQLADLFKTKAFMEITGSGFKFNFVSSIGSELYEGKPLLEASVTGTGATPFKNPQFTIAIEFQQNLQKYVRKLVIDNVGDAQKAVIDGINSVQNEIDKINATKAKAQASIDKARADIAKAHAVADDLRASRDRALQDIEHARKSLDIIRSDIKDLKHWYNSLPKA